MEIASRILYFTPESLDEVEKVYALLTSNYVCNVNVTTGMHVHLGDGTRGFTFPTMQKLIAFIWAFEPQLDTLHPPNRQNHPFGWSMRDRSNFSETWYRHHGERPGPIRGVLELGKEEDLIQLARQGMDHLSGHNSNYNFEGICRIASEDRTNARADIMKPTIEFRQHEGTLDGKRATMWIKTIAGIVRFCQNVQPESLSELLYVVEKEEWEKLGDTEDQELEKRLGPILAEGDFTVIDLFRHMNLDEAADYYSGKVYPADRRYGPTRGTVQLNTGCVLTAKDISVLVTDWEYESALPPESDEFKRMARRRKLWEGMVRIIEAFPDMSLEFDESDPVWPAHYKKNGVQGCVSKLLRYQQGTFQNLVVFKIRL